MSPLSRSATLGGTTSPAPSPSATGSTSHFKNPSVRINTNVDTFQGPHRPETAKSHHSRAPPYGSPGRGEKINLSKSKFPNKRRWKLPQSLEWIPANLTWAKLKPVIRCSVAAWASMILFVVPETLRFMGQASFVILVALFLSPPAEPFMFVLERELLILGFSSLAWAWCCFGIFLAFLARSTKTFNASLLEILSGRFIETAPTIICAIFIFFGSTFFLFIRARKGPGPYLHACVLACLTLDISLTTAIFFPYPNYLIGRAILLPLSFHTAISLLCSIFIFPESVSSLYTKRLQAILTPLALALETHQTCLKTPPDSSEFTSLSSTINETIGKAEDALVPLNAAARLLKSDLVYSRFAPSDFKLLSSALGRLIGRATGMCMYFSLIDPTRERFAMTPAPSLPTSPVMSAMPSRQPSPERHKENEEPQPSSSSVEPSILHTPLTRRRGHQSPDSGSPTQSPVPSRPPSRHLHRNSHGPSSHPHMHPHIHAHSHRAHLHHLHHKLLHLKRSSRHEHVVGMFEVQKYLNLEATRLHTPYSEVYTRQMLELLQESSDGLLGASRDSILAIRDWLGTVFKDKFTFWVSKVKKRLEQEKEVTRLLQVRDRLATELELFRADKRHRVLLPYLPAFDSKPEDDGSYQEIPPHRYLFHCYVYQFHLMLFSEYTLKILDNIIELEKKRRRATLWTPAQHLFRWSDHDQHEHEDEDNPDFISGIELDEEMIPERRDPDALPPSNVLELISSYIYYAIASLFTGNVLFATKAGVLTVLLCIPSFLKSTAPFAFKQKFVWAIFMGQLSLARFRGDTAFAFTSRIISTFFGGVIGMAMWYISSGGDPNGNVYGLAVVFATFLPIFIYARLYWPISPLTNIITWVTTVLVVGYSWLDVQIRLPNTTGVGFSVAWKRLVLVVIGVTAAYLASFLPPSTTIRHYHRKLVSTTCSELGSIYCQIISFANSRRQTEVPEIVTNLLAVRRKLRKAQAVRQNIRYEFSLRGKWPARRYLLILDIQLQIAFALSHLMSIIELLEPAWTRAFLRRTRFNDTDFQGDILAVITMISTALRTAQPLPQITPCPLLDRFMLRFHGLEVIHKEFQDDYGLPRQLSIDTLKNEQYMIFCVGVSTTFSIMTRLDRLMVAAKEVVGEQYYIYGLVPGRHGGVELGPRTESIQLRPPGIV